MNDNKFDAPFAMLLSALGVSLFMLGYVVAVPSKHSTELIKMQNQEYSKCISDLPRNKDCTVTGIVYTITTK